MNLVQSPKKKSMHSNKNNAFIWTERIMLLGDGTDGDVVEQCSSVRSMIFFPYDISMIFCFYDFFFFFRSTIFFSAHFSPP